MKTYEQLAPRAAESLDENGYAIVKGILSRRDCHDLRAMYPDDALYRNTINMERYRFGKGEYKYFAYPLPDIISKLRQSFYTSLYPVANTWMEKLGRPERYPERHGELLGRCRQNGQTRPTPLILRYEQGGYNTLHQDLYGDVYFPFQVVIMLSEPGVEFTGGEFLMTEQVPRAQSRARVLQLAQGDALIFTTNFRPVSGSRGFYRTAVKHGIGEVTSGERYALGIIFHDAR